MVDKEQFYPTPKEVADRLVRMIQVSYEDIVLEPSAGDGALLKAFAELYKYRYNVSERVHCIELNRQRQAILKNDGYSVVWDDFLTFDTMIPYSVILMNPPFRDGASHLLKALQICAPGGQIACILNAETIKNPYTNERKVLLQLLEEQEESNIEFMEMAFADAERPTNVEVALVYVRKKQSDVHCATLEGFRNKIRAQHETAQQNHAVASYGEINAMIDAYKAEVRAALNLYDEIVGYNAIVNACHKDENRDRKIFEIDICGISSEKDSNNPRVNIIRKINYNYWWQILFSKELSALLTGDVRTEYLTKLQDMAEYEFNERNILQMKEDLSRSLIQNIESAIMKVWDEFTSRYAYQEYGR